jgi:hypothetical protein
MCDAKAKMPTQMTNGRSRCYCGASIDLASMDKHVRTAHRSVDA